MRSSSRTAPASPAPQVTESRRGKDGRRLPPCPGVRGSGPRQLTYEVWLRENGDRRTVLTEDSFRKVFVDEGLTSRQAEEKYPELSSLTTSLSKIRHRGKYEQELRCLRHRHHAQALAGNNRGSRAHPGVVLDKEMLAESVQQGRSLPVMSRQFKVSEFLVRSNIRYHGLSGASKLPRSLQEVDWALVERLDSLAPGLKAAALRYYVDPHAYFLLLYEAFCRVQELSWFVKQQAKAHASYVAGGKVPKDHICWSSNQYEIRLSTMLRATGVRHIRQFCLGGNLMADFFLPDSGIVVEVDGEYHAREDTKTRDRLKAETIEQDGWLLIRASNKDLGSLMVAVMEAVASRSFKSSASPQSAAEACGTSRSKRTIRTSRKGS